jgi:hypothetical protein
MSILYEKSPVQKISCAGFIENGARSRYYMLLTLQQAAVRLTGYRGENVKATGLKRKTSEKTCQILFHNI